MAQADRARPRLFQRSSLLFLAGLLLASVLAIRLDGAGQVRRGADMPGLAETRQEMLVPLAPRALTRADRQAARVAWRYIAANTRPETGFVDSVAGYPSTTLWDQGSYILALCAALRLELIDRAEFDDRIRAALASLARLPLFEGKLPNKAYHTVSLQMVDYDNTPVPGGIGWSALDLARMLAALHVLETRAPAHAPLVRGLLAGWDLQALSDKGELIGAERRGGTTRYLQEGRIGYEQYGARAAALWGLDTIAAISARRILALEQVSRTEVPTDLRRAASFRAITPVLSEPYILMGLELGLDSESRALAARVYRAQEARAAQTGIATMVSEDHVNQSPSFLYSSVYANGAPWAVVSEDGSRHDDLRTVSLKAAFAWDALFGRPYTAGVLSALTDLASDGGWYAGRFEITGEINDVLTLNTNAVILEAIHFKAHGPLSSR